MTATAIKERPILFSGPMVRAILDGHKTQTRRIIGLSNRHCEDCTEHRTVWGDGLTLWTDPSTGYPRDVDDPRWLWQPADVMERCCGCSGPFWRCPYGNPGDRLRVRESWRSGEEWDDTKPSKIDPLCGGNDIWYEADGKPTPGYGRLRPSIFLPHWASRLKLEVESVRVERVQDISEADARAEAPPDVPSDTWPTIADWHPVDAFHHLWTSINGPGSWESNPWVWAITFRVLKGASL